MGEVGRWTTLFKNYLSIVDEAEQLSRRRKGSSALGPGRESVHQIGKSSDDQGCSWMLGGMFINDQRPMS
jgi:hypothetical protein